MDTLSTNLDSKRIPITKSDRKAGSYPYYGGSGIAGYFADYIFDSDAFLVSEEGEPVDALDADRVRRVGQILGQQPRAHFEV